MNGDLVDELRRVCRLRAQVGPDLAADVDPDEQVDLVLGLLAAAGVRR